MKSELAKILTMTTSPLDRSIQVIIGNMAFCYLSYLVWMMKTCFSLHSADNDWQDIPLLIQYWQYWMFRINCYKIAPLWSSEVNGLTINQLMIAWRQVLISFTVQTVGQVYTKYTMLFSLASARNVKYKENCVNNKSSGSKV